MKMQKYFFFFPWRRPPLLWFSFFLFSSFIFTLSSCKRSTEPIYNPQKLQLTVADVSCTEAWLHLKTELAEKDSSGLKLQLYRNDSLILNKILTTADSVLYVDGLQPATTYSFSAKVFKNDKIQAASNQLPATTLDTTSHNFTWQTFEFGGQGGSSSFYDVAIINENDIWAVGEIYTADDTYNAAHWNGEKWELRKVPYVDKTGYVWITPLYSVFAFSSNDIWFESGVHWNGNRFVSLRMNINFPSHVNKIWGTSDNDLYVVGNHGLIAHYDGRQWQRIESGTEIAIQDIWGVKDSSKNKNEIICAAAPGYGISHSDVFQIKDNNSVLPLQWIEGRVARSIWFNNITLIFACGSGILRYDHVNGWKEVGGMEVIPAQTERIRGQKINDIFIVGDFGFIAHYNGINFNVINKNSSVIFASCDFKKNTFISVGYNGRSAFIELAKR